MHSLDKFLRQVYSQNGEDGIIEEIFRRISIIKGWFVEFGAWDGNYLSNTRLLREIGWSGVYVEADIAQYSLMLKNIQGCKDVYAFNARVDCSDNNLDKILSKTPIPDDFDFLSIDIDGNDYWIWKACSCKPKIVIIEYNCHFDPTESKSIPYDPDFRYTYNRYHGASVLALTNLANKKGYSLVARINVCNLIYVRNDFMHLFDKLTVEEVPKQIVNDPVPPGKFFVDV